MEEKEALSGLMKKDYSRNKTININLNKLQKRLEETKFSGVDLKDVINMYFKEEIVTNKENKQKYQEELEEFFENVIKKNEGTYIYKYLKYIFESKNQIYYNLKKYYNKDKEVLGKALEDVCKGINNLPKNNIRIPVFASNILNNPHGFDKKNLSGTIFIMFLSFINDMPKPRNSEELSELYYKNHLLVDDVSNMVLCRNILGFIETGNEQHEGLNGFARYHEPIYLTIYNLANISFLDKNNKYKKVLVTENPAVFMEITEKCNVTDFPLVCTYGQVKLAGIILLDLLVQAGFKLYYSGDIDPEGIQIADRLKKRYGDKLDFIGFDVDTYFRNLSDVYVSESRLSKLKQIKSDYLLKTCIEMEKQKKVAYEEENIRRLIMFIEKIIN